MSVWVLEIGDDEVDLAKTEKAFRNYRRAVVRAARRNLKQLDKNASGKLSSSLRIVTENEDGELKWSPKGTPYLEFVDLGVQGARSNRKAPESPFKFGSGTGQKGKLVPAIDRWVVVKPVEAGRDEKGRFVERKELVRRIARFVYLNGLETTNFISDPFVQLWKRYEEQFADAMYQDIQTWAYDQFGEDVEFKVKL